MYSACGDRSKWRLHQKSHIKLGFDDCGWVCQTRGRRKGLTGRGKNLNACALPCSLLSISQNSCLLHSCLSLLLLKPRPSLTWPSWVLFLCLTVSFSPLAFNGSQVTPPYNSSSLSPDITTTPDCPSLYFLSPTSQLTRDFRDSGVDF